MIEKSLRPVDGGKWVADVRGLGYLGFTYTTDEHSEQNAAVAAADRFIFWFENAPAGNAESLYYILSVPLVWPGPPARAHPYSGLHVKIGRTMDVERRVASLRTGTNDLLIVHALEPGDPATERKRHEQFREERRQGEWFACSPVLAQHILTTWERNNLLPAQYQQEILLLHERIRMYRPVREVFQGSPDMMNPSLNEPWTGKVFVDLMFALRNAGTK